MLLNWFQPRLDFHSSYGSYPEERPVIEPSFNPMAKNVAFFK